MVSFNVLNFYDALIIAIQSIWRNKRRSMALLSGVILGTVILSGIVIYTGVLQEENYRSIVNDASFEITFTLSEGGEETDLWALSSAIADNPKVLSSTVLGGDAMNFEGETTFFYSVLSYSLETQDDSGNDDFRVEETKDTAPMFVRDNFTETSMYQQLIKDEFTGSFNLSISRNSTVIPKSTASLYNLKVGDIIPHVNFTYVKFGSEVPIEEYYEIMMTNVYISGIYETKSSSDAGIFSDIFASDYLYFNTETLYQYAPYLVTKFEDEKKFFLAIKINEDEFTLSDVGKLNSQIDRLINEITILSGDTVEGTNQVTMLLLPFTILNFILTFFDYILVLPIVVLSIYLLLFGLELSLEERKREIAIFKVQGAKSSQIFNRLRDENLLILAIGLTIGYFLAMIGAWIISSSVGFLKFNLGTYDDLQDFIRFDRGAFLTSFVVIGMIVFIATRKKGKEFIELEVSEAVQKATWKKDGFFRRNKLDLVMLVIGLISAFISIASAAFDYSIKISPFVDIFVIGFLGTIFLWVGGALYGARIAKWIAQRLQPQLMKVNVFKDIGIIVKSGLKRRGDIDRLVVIIVLTLSVATLAASQGFTDEVNSIRTLEYEIGADYHVQYTSLGANLNNFNEVYGIKDVIALPAVQVGVLSTTSILYGMESSIVDKAIWHEDSFKDVSASKAFSELEKHDNGVIVGEGLADDIGSKVGDTIRLKVYYFNPIDNETYTQHLEVKVVALLNHAPGDISSGAMIANYEVLYDLNDLVANFTLPRTELLAGKYLVNRESNMDHNDLKNSLSNLVNVYSVRDLEEEKSELGSQANFGIPGLLSMMFFVAVVGSLTSAFAFSAIIMERRKREFAVLQTIGASRRQIYKTALGENALMMLTSVVWGIIIGIGASFQMNGLFIFIGIILGRGGVTRIVEIPWGTIAIIGIATYAGMLVATVLSVRSAARQDLSVATRVV
ncbi:MAG: FtsX-like permease family protein [Candidatus Kariarchaeaceae archaeon]